MSYYPTFMFISHREYYRSNYIHSLLLSIYDIYCSIHILELLLLLLMMCLINTFNNNTHICIHTHTHIYIICIINHGLYIWPEENSFKN